VNKQFLFARLIYIKENDIDIPQKNLRKILNCSFLQNQQAKDKDQILV